MFIILFLCVCFLLIVLSVYNIKYKNKKFWKKRHVVESKHTLQKYILGNQSLAEVYKEIYDAYPKEPYVGTFRGTEPTLLLRDLENIQLVLAGDFVNFHSRGLSFNSNDKLADNILFMDDFNRWKVVRQRISPGFTTLRLKSMYDVAEKCARDFIKFIEENEQSTKSPFNSLYTYTTASTGASIFGVDTRSRNAMESPFLEMSWESTAPSFRNNFMFGLNNTFPWLFKVLGLTFFGRFENFFIGAVKKVIKVRRENPIQKYDVIDLFINLLEQPVVNDLGLNYQLNVTEELLAAQAFIFFIAGADTSANTMHFTLFELANNPDILKRVHEEIDKVFVESDENVTFDDLDKLKYLDMVIDESMRKYSPIGVLQRKCIKDTVLPVGNIKVEKDVLVIIPVYAIHRDENYYPHPEKFDPDRFKQENVQNRRNYSYLPFGEGNRICIGMRFAQIQVKIGLAWLLRKYSLREQTVKLDTYEKSFFSLRATNAHYELIKRENSA